MTDLSTLMIVSGDFFCLMVDCEEDVSGVIRGSPECNVVSRKTLNVRSWSDSVELCNVQPQLPGPLEPYGQKTHTHTHISPPHTFPESELLF